MGLLQCLQLTEEEGSGSIAMSIAGSGDGSTADRGGGEWVYCNVYS